MREVRLRVRYDENDFAGKPDTKETALQIAQTARNIYMSRILLNIENGYWNLDNFKKSHHQKPKTCYSAIVVLESFCANIRYRFNFIDEKVSL